MTNGNPKNEDGVNNAAEGAAEAQSEGAAETKLEGAAETKPEQLAGESALGGGKPPTPPAKPQPNNRPDDRPDEPGKGGSSPETRVETMVSTVVETTGGSSPADARRVHTAEDERDAADKDLLSKQKRIETLEGTVSVLTEKLTSAETKLRDMDVAKAELKKSQQRVKAREDAVGERESIVATATTVAEEATATAKLATDGVDEQVAAAKARASRNGWIGLAASIILLILGGFVGHSLSVPSEMTPNSSVVAIKKGHAEEIAALTAANDVALKAEKAKTAMALEQVGTVSARLTVLQAERKSLTAENKSLRAAFTGTDVNPDAIAKLRENLEETRDELEKLAVQFEADQSTLATLTAWRAANEPKIALWDQYVAEAVSKKAAARAENEHRLAALLQRFSASDFEGVAKREFQPMDWEDFQSVVQTGNRRLFIQTFNYVWETRRKKTGEELDRAIAGDGSFTPAALRKAFGQAVSLMAILRS